PGADGDRGDVAGRRSDGRQHLGYRRGELLAVAHRVIPAGRRHDALVVAQGDGDVGGGGVKGEEHEAQAYGSAVPSSPRCRARSTARVRSLTPSPPTPPRWARGAWSPVA